MTRKCVVFPPELERRKGRLTVQFVDLRQVGENAGQLFGVEHRPHLLEKHLIKDLQGAQVRDLGGKELWWGRGEEGLRFEGLRRDFLGGFLTRTVDDRLPVHFPLSEFSQKLRGDLVLPVLAVAHLLLQRRKVGQQRHW